MYMPKRVSKPRRMEKNKNQENRIKDKCKMLGFFQVLKARTLVVCFEDDENS